MKAEDNQAGIGLVIADCLFDTSTVCEPRVPAMATETESVFDLLCLSTNDAAKLRALPKSIQDIFHDQTNLLIAELEQGKACQEKSRGQFPIRRLPYVIEQVNIGGQLLEQFIRVWKASIQHRQALL